MTQSFQNQKMKTFATISGLVKETTKTVTTLAVAAMLWNCNDHDIQNTQYELNDEVSVAEWKGYLKTGFFNQGSIAVKSNSLVIEQGKVKSGSFTIPVSSIINFNQPTEELKHQLVHHLQSPDFFNMVLHPNVSFDITSVTPFNGTGDDVVPGANYLVNGNLTMLGISHSISFKAKIDLTGDDFKLEGKASFDRTLWGITFATQPGLPDEASIKPDVDVFLKLSGTKK